MSANSRHGYIMAYRGFVTKIPLCYGLAVQTHDEGTCLAIHRHQQQLHDGINAHIARSQHNHALSPILLRASRGFEGRVNRRWICALQTQHGRPCTKVGGRPRVALRTPRQLCNCPAHPKLRPARKREHWASDRGRINSSRALLFLAPATSSPKCDQADILLVFGAVTAQPLENRLARPIRSPPSSRRAYAVRWSQVIHRNPPLL